MFYDLLFVYCISFVLSCIAAKLRMCLLLCHGVLLSAIVAIVAVVAIVALKVYCCY